MADNLSASVGWRLADMLKGDTGAKQPSQSGTASFVRMDDDGTAWIRILGNNFDTPVEGGVYVDAKEGDTVTYTISGGQVSISGNATSPAVGGTYVTEKVKPVERKAMQAKTAADVATEEASRAHDAADAAQASADDAATAASSAQSSADDAATAAQQAIEDAATADGKAEAAATAASNAQTSANSAASAASAAQTSANSAAAAAAVADEKAVAAGNAAAAAQRSANSANTYANAALDQLGIVQDVIGVLTWATEHGSFSLTSDTTIVDGKVYFTYDSQTGDYTPVIDPQASALSTYYELSVDEAMESYIMAHLAVTSRGLWVLPSGIGSGTTPASGESQQDSDARQGSGYKMLLAANGIYLYDSNGVVATNVGENITFSSYRDWYVGSNDAYIFYDASEGVINIGGTGVEFNGTKTLSDLLSDVSDAAQTASAASSAVTTEASRRKATYGTCSTSASTTAKIVVCDGFEPYTGARITVNMTTASTATAPTLTIQNSGGTVLLAAKAVWFGNAVASSTNPVRWAANATLDFVYDGTEWVLDETPPTYVVVNDTSASTRAKATSLDGALVVNGTTVTARFTNANTYASNSVQFNLGSTGAMPIYTDNAVTSSTHTFLWDADTVMTLAQQGGSWHLVDGRAKALSEEAKKVATNYISVDTNGIRIASSSPSTATTYQHQTATETEFIVDSESRLLVSGDGIRVGKPYVSGDTDNESHMEIDYHSLQLVDRDGDTYFFVSDLRDRDGYVTDEFVCDGETTEFALSVSCDPTTAVAKIDGTQATNVTYGMLYVKLVDAPSSGSILSVRYEPMPAFSQKLKAYTLGTRKEHQRIGTYSTVEGTDNTASGECSHAEGVGTTASARSSHSEGYQTEAIGSDSHAEGNSTDATGMVSHAEGVITKASGKYSHAEGYGSEARGESSHAEGYYTQALGNNSHAQNCFTSAIGENQTVLGRYNVLDANDTYAVIVGNGTANNARSNALTVDWLGNIWAAGKATLTDAIEAASAAITGVISAAKLAITKDSQDTGTTAASINDGTSDVLTVDWSGNVRSAGNLLYIDAGSYGTAHTYLEAVDYNTGATGTRVGSTRNVSGTDIYNNINLNILADGTRQVVFSNVVPWQKALDTHYLPGDTISGSCRAGGYVTYNTRDIRWTIPLSKPISGSVSCTSMSMSVRMAGTYIWGSASGNASVPVAKLTCSVTPSGIDCQYRDDGAISGATNNSECAVQVTYSFTVS